MRFGQSFMTEPIVTSGLTSTFLRVTLVLAREKLGTCSVSMNNKPFYRCFTGKGIEYGGSEMRPEATGPWSCLFLRRCSRRRATA